MNLQNKYTNVNSQNALENYKYHSYLGNKRDLSLPNQYSRNYTGGSLDNPYQSHKIQERNY